MCLGMPGRVIEVSGKTARVEFWGAEKSVRIDALGERVTAGDYIITHSGSAVRVIPAGDVADTMALYEVVLCEAGEDPIAADALSEIEETDAIELLTA